MSRQTIGLLLPSPGSATFHLMFFVSLHSSGGVAAGASPVPSGPRHIGHACGAPACRAAGAAGRVAAGRPCASTAIPSARIPAASATPSATIPTLRPPVNCITSSFRAAAHPGAPTCKPERGMMRALVRCGLLLAPGFRLIVAPCLTRRHVDAPPGAFARGAWPPPCSSGWPVRRWRVRRRQPPPRPPPRRPRRQQPSQRVRRRAPTPTRSGPTPSRRPACRAARSRGR